MVGCIAGFNAFAVVFNSSQQSNNSKPMTLVSTGILALSITLPLVEVTVQSFFKDPFLSRQNRGTAWITPSTSAGEALAQTFMSECARAHTQ